MGVLPLAWNDAETVRVYAPREEMAMAETNDKTGDHATEVDPEKLRAAAAKVSSDTSCGR